MIRHLFALGLVVSLHSHAEIHSIAKPIPLVNPAVMAKWLKVNLCEEGGKWHVRGAVYSGGLGITETNWMKFGGWKFSAEYAATPEQQVYIAEKIEQSAGLAGYVPDQYGCGKGW